MNVHIPANARFIDFPSIVLLILAIGLPVVVMIMAS
jgi:hypothetical protein